MQESPLKSRISTIPHTPGVYLYKDARNRILYVGKGKNLHARVRSYFTKSADLGPTKEKMVSLIADFETITTDTELEALILEANLIRKHQPPYNVLLRDDKYYLFIKITKEDVPRIFPVRKITKDGAKYFGPYSSASSVRSTLKLLRRIFPFREEKDSPRDIIFPHPLFTQHNGHVDPGSKPGVTTSPQGDNSALADRHAGPDCRQAGLDPACLPARQASTLTPDTAEDRTSRAVDDYNLQIESVMRFLKGQRDEIIKTLENGIQESSQKLEFERAGLFRDQLQAIMRLEGSQKVYLPTKESFDVISIAHTDRQSAGNVLQIRDGKLLGKQTFLLRHALDTPQEDILRQFIIQYYGVAQDIPKTIYIPFEVKDVAVLHQWIGGSEGVEFLIPQRGTKRKLLVMGEANAQALLHEQDVATQTKQASQKSLTSLLTAIGITPPHFADASRTRPFRIETYDISNIQGTLATASMIVFLDGMPAKNEYRKFRIKYEQSLDPSQHKSNDFAMLEEALTRRFSHLSDTEQTTRGGQTWPTPDLIIIDGGKGQLSSAVKALHASGVSIPIISIAKQEEEIFMPNQPTSIRIPYDSPALHLIQRMRDEAHRFTITYHRTLRSKEHIKSVLDEISGIGPKTKKMLLKTFGSVSGIKSAEDSELIKLIGKKKTDALREQL